MSSLLGTELRADRFRPREGWVASTALTVHAIFLLWSVSQVEWVPEVGIIWAGAVIGFATAVMAVRWQLSTWLSWLLITMLIGAYVFIYMSRFSPWRIVTGWENFIYFSGRQWDLFILRLNSWGTAAVSGTATGETIVFAMLLGLAAGFLFAFLAWALYRWHNPMVALVPNLFAFGFNAFYGRSSGIEVAFFLMVTWVAVAAYHRMFAEQRWNIAQIDYSEDARFDVFALSAVISVLMVLFAVLIPAVPVTDIARWFQRSEPVQAAEDTLERLFGGVQQPSAPGSAGTLPSGPPPPVGEFPRDYLLGNPPELAEIPVFSATVSELPPQARHWRAGSYDIYTGSGWEIGTERWDRLPAGETLSDELMERPTILVEQQIRWLAPIPGTTVLTIGPPVTVDAISRRYTRVDNELSRVRFDTPELRPGYTAISAFPDYAAADLRLAGYDSLSPDLYRHYTALPPNLSPRVVELAGSVTANAETAYDQAKALEAFLRQYRYDLDVEPPPPGVEPVEYFLFELQAGYCDYYATAMVVMARSLGLPARLGIGYAIPPTDETTMTVFQNTGHSWAEIYFDGYGWIEFEPTAAYPISGFDRFFAERGIFEDEPLATLPVPWSRQALARFWGIIAGAIGVVLLVGTGRYLRNRQPAEAVLWTYRRLARVMRRLGVPSSQSATPAERIADYDRRLQHLDRRNTKDTTMSPYTEPLTELQTLVESTAYDRPADVNTQRLRDRHAFRLWQTIRRPLERWQVRSILSRLLFWRRT